MSKFIVIQDCNFLTGQRWEELEIKGYMMEHFKNQLAITKYLREGKWVADD